MQNYVNAGDKFTDENFPPDKSSLIEKGVNPGDIDWNSISWRRPEDILEFQDVGEQGELAVFNRGTGNDELVTPNDIR